MNYSNSFTMDDLRELDARLPDVINALIEGRVRGLCMVVDMATDSPDKPGEVWAFHTMDFEGSDKFRMLGAIESAKMDFINKQIEQFKPRWVDGDE